ncbi:MAG: hypothetical protein CMM49_04080 [Rhodospirillaceae bacterium]|nr:hypothetical protein [Rhodospirillaceae bacterium]|tara:strand:+ start:2838 stop:3497 length:660 start_codon:yes stop_codon:yes gene_type:complete
MFALERFRLILFIIFILSLFLSNYTNAQQQKKNLYISDICDNYFKEHETSMGIPPHLLKAISLKETGRWDNSKKESFTWPWTVTAGKWSHYFQTKENAIRAVKRLQLRNISNIDVGCMQINLKYHPNAFKTLEEAFDPRSNILYATKFLKKLYKNEKSWHRSIEKYHSSNPKYSFKYRSKVDKIWKKVRSIEAHKKRAAVKKAYIERKAKYNINNSGKS